MEFHAEADYTEKSPANENSLTVKMPIGKHKGRELGELASSWNGRRYLEFMLTVNSLYAETRQAIEETLNNTHEVEMTLAEAGDVVVRFGQYKGETLRQICKKKGGVGYLRYVCNWDKCTPELLHACDTVLEEFNKQKQSK
jgi:uncharacterized protein (DUF3820 family)